jgi:hypothetical protein
MVKSEKVEHHENNDTSYFEPPDVWRVAEMRPSIFVNATNSLIKLDAEEYTTIKVSIVHFKSHDDL